MARPGELIFDQPLEGTLAIRISGSWKLHKDLPSVDAISRQLEQSPGLQKIRIDARDVDEWDSGLLIFLGRTLELATQQDLELQTIDLPDGAAKLLQLAVAVPETKDARKAPEPKTFFVHLGDQTVDFIEGCGDLLEFVGEATMAFSKFIRGKAQYRRSDLALILESCSGQAASTWNPSRSSRRGSEKGTKVPLVLMSIRRKTWICFGLSALGTLILSQCFWPLVPVLPHERN